MDEAENASIAQMKKRYGNSCMQKGKYVEAIMEYTEAIQLEPANAVLYGNRSLAFLKEKQYFFAMKDAETTIRLAPEWAKGYYRKGQVEFTIEAYADAIASYKRGLKKSPYDKILLKAKDEANKGKLQVSSRRQFKVKLFAVAFGLVGGILLALDQFSYKYLVEPWQNVLIVSGSAFLGVLVSFLSLLCESSKKEHLLLPPVDLLTGCDLDYLPKAYNRRGDEMKHGDRFANRKTN